jgi:hypothetical protein
MFGSKQRKIDELELENAELADKLAELKDKEKRKQRLDDNLCDAFGELYKSSFAFDWKTGKAFSIERIQQWNEYHEHYIPTTVIGYYKNEEGAIGEWRFYCSQEEHERLVKDFNDYKKKTK